MAEVEKKMTIVPLWYVTFADLSTLMLTFFVLLLSFSNTDIQKFRDTLGSLKGAFGVAEQRVGEAVPVLTGEEAFQDAAESLAMSAAEAAEVEDLQKEMQDMKEQSKLSESTSVFIRKNEVVIRVDGGTFFRSGSSKLNKSSYKILKGLASLMKRADYFLTVEGHTDSIPIRSRRFPSNWELSGVRATTVLRYMVYKGVNVDRIRAIGYADTHPIADNITPEGRGRNRRVEFILKKLKQKKHKKQ